VVIGKGHAREARRALTLPDHLKGFGALVGRTREARLSAGDSVIGEADRIPSTLEFVPDYISWRVLAPSANGEPVHLLDAYFYQEVRTGARRCLALSPRGGVHEGERAAMSEGVGGALQLNLTVYDDDRVYQLIARFDFEANESLRQRIWSLERGERTLVLDMRHSTSTPPSGLAR
jgi:hypothetical protein